MLESVQRIVLVGAGGLGVPTAWRLVSGWSKRPLKLEILDPDHIELSNLPRQVFYRDADIGSPKASLLAERVGNYVLGYRADISSSALRLTAANVDSLLSGASFVIDACDCPRTKFVINDYCVKNRIPFCYGGVFGTYGQMLTYDPVRRDLPACLRCLFGDFLEEQYQHTDHRCSQAGILGPVAGLIGFAIAGAALTCLSSAEEKEGSGSELLRFSLENLVIKESHVPPSSTCSLACLNLDQESKGTLHKEVEPLALQAQQTSPGPASALDLRDKQCPMTFVFTKLALEKMASQELLEVLFSGEDSVNNVAESVRLEGHRVREVESRGDQSWRLVIEKG